MKLSRSERRRRKRESSYAQSMNEPDPFQSEVSMALPTVLAKLTALDRSLVIARYLEEKSFKRIGEEYGFSEDTAQKRVSRAIENLRKRLAASGITSSAALLGNALADHRVSSVSSNRVTTMRRACQSALETSATSWMPAASWAMAGWASIVVAVVAGFGWMKLASETSSASSPSTTSEHRVVERSLSLTRQVSTWRAVTAEERITDAREAIKRVLAWKTARYKATLEEYQDLMRKGESEEAQKQVAQAKKMEGEINAMRYRNERYFQEASTSMRDANKALRVREAMVSDDIPSIPERDYGDQEERILVERVMRRLRQRREGEGEAELRDALAALTAKVGEESPLIYHLSAQELYALGNKQEAHQMLLDVYKHSSEETPWIAAFQGDLLFRAGQYEDSLAWYQAANPAEDHLSWTWSRWLAVHLTTYPWLRQILEQHVDSAMLPEIMILEAVRAAAYGQPEESKIWVDEALGLDAHVAKSAGMDALSAIGSLGMDD